MRVVVPIVLLILLLVLVVLVFTILQPKAQRQPPATVGQTTAARQRRETAPVPDTAGPTNRHAITEPQDGFFIGKGDQRVFVKYGTADPVLRSFLQSVMDESSDPRAKGRDIYLKLCGICHQPDGEGKDGLAPPLVGSEWALAVDGGRMVRIVLNGLMGPVRVRGRDWNLAMPPWRENLSDDQVSLVLTYVRSQLGSNHASAITPEFVAETRKEAHKTPQTADEVLRISDK